MQTFFFFREYKCFKKEINTLVCLFVCLFVCSLRRSITAVEMAQQLTGRRSGWVSCLGP